jgi:hypothetical protein
MSSFNIGSFIEICSDTLFPGNLNHFLTNLKVQKKTGDDFQSFIISLKTFINIYIVRMSECQNVFVLTSNTKNVLLLKRQKYPIISKAHI